jgi:hypothetical protein
VGGAADLGERNPGAAKGGGAYIALLCDVFCPIVNHPAPRMAQGVTSIFTFSTFTFFKFLTKILTKMNRNVFITILKICSRLFYLLKSTFIFITYK